jgi:ComF family protein
LKIKFHEQLTYAAVLGEALTETIRGFPQADQAIDYLLPVPLSPKRLKQRGFNQALEIARPLSKALGIALRPELVKRIRHTPAQSDLPASDRGKNVQKAFWAAQALRGKSVVIIDDVLTTGHTLRSLCAALLDVKVASIEVWCCARALKS